jgi:hypothetical protein
MRPEGLETRLSNDVVPVHRNIDADWKPVRLRFERMVIKLTIDKRRKVGAAKRVEIVG